MLSVVVVGRNDSHGYNLSKRVATSLNSIALPMTGSDELIFVDWNTEDINPTFVDAIRDTLTSHTLKHLVVYRVRPRTHRQIAHGSPRPILEPVARNAGIRRALNPWVLSTNTDMIFDTFGNTYHDIISRLQPNLYHLFRYEIPEFIWDQFDRMDPNSTLQYIRSIFAHKGMTAKILTQPYEGHSNLFPDAVGDFQLATKEIWESVRGFPENMLLGWHVDSRLSVQIESTTQLKSEIINPTILQGFHQNHLRVLTHFHKNTNINPLEIISQPYQNPSTWGLDGILLENSFDEIFKISRFLEKNDSPSELSSNSQILQELLESPFYEPELVNFFLLDDILNLSTHSTIYISSINPDFCQNLMSLLDSLNIDTKLFEIRNFPDYQVKGLIDLFILDFGIPINLKNSNNKLVEIFESVVVRNIEILNNLPENQRVIAIRAQHWSIRGLINENCHVPLFNNYSSVLSGKISRHYNKKLFNLKNRFKNLIRRRIFITHSKSSLSNQYKYTIINYQTFGSNNLGLRLPVSSSMLIYKVYKKFPFQVRAFLNPKIRKFFNIY